MIHNPMLKQISNNFHKLELPRHLLISVGFFLFLQMKHVQTQTYDEAAFFERAKCYGDKKARCICDIPQVIKNLKQYPGIYEKERLQDTIRGHFCQKYVLLPDSLLIDASPAGSIFEPEPYANDYQSYGVERSLYDLRDRKRYSRRRFKRQIRLGAPTNQVFEDAVAHVQPHAFHQYVILGSMVRFQCSGDMDEEMDGSRVTRIVWTHFNGEPITTPQVSIDADSGTLTIPTVQLSDIDIYNCTLHKHTEDGIHKSSVYSHQLSVISEPIFWLQMSVEYETKHCNHQEIKLIRSKLGSWVEAHICPQCEVHNDTIGCSYSNSDFSSTYKIQLVVSAIGTEIQMEKAIAERLYACPISCLELMQTKILEHVRDNMMKVFKLPSKGNTELITPFWPVMHCYPFEVKGNGDNKLVHLSVIDSFQVELLMGCLAGFFLHYKLCFPCSPGSFSSYGSTECFPCPMSNYQPQPAASSCLPCGEGLETVDIGSVSYSECHSPVFAESAKTAQEVYQSISNPANNTLTTIIIVSVVSGVFVLLLIVLISICICCPNTGCGQCLKKFCCCCCGGARSGSYEPLSPEDPQDNKIRKDESNSKPRHKKHSKDVERPKSKSKVHKPKDAARATSKPKGPPPPPPMPPSKKK